MTDKRMTADEMVAQLRDGMTLGIGGWGSRRKPMALVRAILRSDLTDLTVVSYGGPDVGLLAAAGKIRRLVFGFVTLDSVPIDPNFARARQSGAIEVSEWDEGMFAAGLKAAVQRLPFQPIRAGLGSAVMSTNPDLKTVRSPYSDGEELVAVPPLHLDASLIHMNRADARGNAQYLGPDPYFDDDFALAAERCYVSCEKIVSTEELAAGGPVQSLLINRSAVTGVIETPNGAHFTTAAPDYGRDEKFQRHYAASAKSPDAWATFTERFLTGDEAHYQAEVAAWSAEQEDAK
ncbi:Coenzyme A transferase OS=Tsukamurella paurometabola (strain ATCC 8368 / DSM / CCUG 35730 /CIP 100753 / JCM 10117 / KCTC 9821 / NBRC 16120 / NCIMB 702349/ NCTC 13040) OX=521096 GN=Tpau_3827 PE=4 SV=1 [Tsukamurella paurometabola]|uniref:Coenzyme A transferase n=1 Tax=Tsukamurella paurometabola (strain ATCC 8368 / DSM 20162 / CCUG 35730 / CIP 100753 / JCM 10117 / KCTC 9821 / NBRC 16120 / NCIMB 702349 / NCTC 13040) TaxID=521096 RepID=D5UYU9_TSUPD|nr:CoA-transferase [Tsukamurella paurometabola]ADG80402.1 coenzyme A transferase [Tsukamurella paurometabola DSM 20162]SUP39501.1 3-oxoadipate CoA-transferase subunit A [Tsukamurella paurometabola]